MRLKNHKKVLEGQNIFEICNNIVRRPLTTFAFPKKFFVQKTFVPIRLLLHSFKTFCHVKNMRNGDSKCRMAILLMSFDLSLIKVFRRQFKIGKFLPVVERMCTEGDRPITPIISFPGYPCRIWQF